MFNGVGYRAWSFFKRLMLGLLKFVMGRIPYFRFIRETADTQVPITWEIWWDQVFLARHKGLYWPIDPTSVVEDYQNVLIGVHTSPGYSPGCYIQGRGRVYIGDYTQIAQNVGIITAQWDVPSNSNGSTREVRIGKYAWIGMNAVILPGVELGDFTVVGAGAVVTKSFPEGYCVIGGNPASIIRRLDPEKCVRYTHPYEYVGFLRKKDFEAYRRRNLQV